MYYLVVRVSEALEQRRARLVEVLAHFGSAFRVEEQADVSAEGGAHLMCIWMCVYGCMWVHMIMKHD